MRKYTTITKIVMTEKNCEHPECNNKFIPKSKSHKFCSTKCSLNAQFRKTYVHKGKNGLGSKTKLLWKDPEYRQHMIDVHKGHPAWNKGQNVATNTGRTRFKKGQPSLRKGIPHTEETKKKLSESRKGKGSGADHWNWKGGISFQENKTIIKHHKKESKQKKENEKIIDWQTKVLEYMKSQPDFIVKSFKRKSISEEHAKKLMSINKGKTVSEETREKIRRSRLGVKNAEAWNKGLSIETDERVKSNIIKMQLALNEGRKNGTIKSWTSGIKIDRKKYPNYGHNTKHSLEAIAKMKLARKGKSAYWNKGEKSPMWKGGVTPEQKRLRRSIEFFEWRDLVFTRDNWTCQKYKTRGGKLHPHHIQNFSDHPELRFEVSNGITLSEKAHKEFHLKYGKRNNTLEQILEFISS